VPELPPELDELVLSLLDVDCAARPPSAAHVMERLSALAKLPREQDEAHVALSYLQHPPLVGRESSLGELRTFLGAAVAGHSRGVMIEGTSGLGRSALLDQLASEAQLAGANVLRFQPRGALDGGLVFVTLQAMRAAFPALWSETRAKHGVLRDALAPLPHATLASELSERRGEISAAAVSCVLEMSRHAPVVLLVDDVHRVDAESLAVIAQGVVRQRRKHRSWPSLRHHVELGSSCVPQKDCAIEAPWSRIYEVRHTRRP
jgi:hypothetical protein